MDEAIYQMDDFDAGGGRVSARFF